jgi:hypothetical protein
MKHLLIAIAFLAAVLGVSFGYVVSQQPTRWDAKNPDTAHADPKKVVCQTMVGDRMVKLWVEPVEETDSMKITNEKGESVTYGKMEGPEAWSRLFDPTLMLVFSMVHEGRCKPV